MFKLEFIQRIIHGLDNEMSGQNVPDPDVTLIERVFRMINSRGWGSILLAVASSGGVSYIGGVNSLLIASPTFPIPPV